MVTKSYIHKKRTKKKPRRHLGWCDCEIGARSIWPLTRSGAAFPTKHTEMTAMLAQPENTNMSKSTVCWDIETYVKAGGDKEAKPLIH